MRSLRRELDLTQADLAKKAGCSTDTIRKLESDQRRASRELVTRLAGLFGLSHRERADFMKLARGLGAVSGPPLPAPLTGLIGREADVAAVRQLVLQAEVRLVTLVGAPGIGKTRLALQVAHELQDHFRDGAVLVRLAEVRNPDLVVDAIAEALGVRATSKRPVGDAVCDWLRYRHVLLVLDNFEQVLAARERISSLLAQLPGLTVVVTSREALGIYGEHLFIVSALELPPASRAQQSYSPRRTASERLFLERARAMRPRFASAPADAADVGEICVRLEGLPLAIELAACRARSMSPRSIREGLGDQLDLLSAGPADFPPRQRSMRGALDWSYALLTDAEQQMFSGMAVFAGGATPESALAVCAGSGEMDAARNALENLASKSLISYSEAHGSARFVMLEVVREYALEQLVRIDEGNSERRLRRAHAHHFSQLAARAETGLRGSDQVAWLHQLDADHANFQLALGYSLETLDGVVLGELCARLWPFWRRRGYYDEGRRWITRSLALGRAVPERCRASALNGLGVLAILQGDYALAETSLTDALQLADAQILAEEAALATSNLGWLAHDRNEPDRAQHLFEESLRLRQMLGDTAGQAASLDNLGMVALERNDLRTACDLFERSARLYRPNGDSLGLAQALTNLGWAHQELGEYAPASQLFSESLDVARRLEWTRGIASATANLALMSLYAGDSAAASDLFVDSLSVLNELGDRRGVAQTLEGLAGVAAVQGRADEAARYLGAAHALREQIGAPLLPANRSWLDPFVDAAREQVSEDAWLRAWTEGRGASLEVTLSRLLD